MFSLVRSGRTIVQPQVADVRAPVPLPRRTSSDSRGGSACGAHRGRVPARAGALPARRCCSAYGDPDLAAGYGRLLDPPCFAHAVRAGGRDAPDAAVGDRAVHVHAHFAHDPALVGLLVAQADRAAVQLHRPRPRPAPDPRARAWRPGRPRRPPSSPAARPTPTTSQHGPSRRSCAAGPGRPPRGRPRAVRTRGRPGRHLHDPCCSRSGGWWRRRASPTCCTRCSAVAAGGAGFRCRMYGDGPLHDELSRDERRPRPRGPGGAGRGAAAATRSSPRWAAPTSSSSRRWSPRTATGTASPTSSSRPWRRAARRDDVGRRDPRAGPARGQRPDVRAGRRRRAGHVSQPLACRPRDAVSVGAGR